MKKDWLIIGVAFAVGVLATFVQCSVTPLLPVLKDRFGLSYADAGLLMTLFALATLVCATPCGLVIQRFGERRVGLWGLASMAAGLALGLLATRWTLHPLFLAGRAVQGIGFALVAVAAPAAIGRYVARPLLPLAMGIWSTWIPCGSLIMFFAAPRLLDRTGLETYWLLLLLALVPGMLAYALVIPPATGGPGKALPSRQVLLEEFGNGKVWAAAIAFAAYTFGFFSLATWITTYLSENLGQTILQAADASILYWPFSMLSNLYGGYFLKRFGTNRWLFILPPAGLAVLWPLYAIPSLGAFYAVLVAMGLIAGIVPTIIFASGPLLAKRPEGIGAAMAVIIIGENLGILVGPEVFGILRQYSGGFTLGFSALSLGALLQILMLYRIWQTGVFGPKPARA
ncbi:MAG: MFS transporter [Solidesulfovibrio sp. DCME]|uniref:MFS transporter n=1 Tax=Solidesulfovibrio sp. DCME TaxID=3447380 RepID=UPI003D11DAE2